MNVICEAFYINNDYECLLIKNPESLQENRKDCPGAQAIWTNKSPKPLFIEYIMVTSGKNNGALEVLDLGKTVKKYLATRKFANS